jgi:transcriptional regulator with XRE-family HTH domain
MSRENYSQLETGRRKEPLTPQQAKAISKLFGIPMLTLVNAMGYPVEVEGFENEEEVALLDRYRHLPPTLQQAVRAVAGLPLPPQVYEASPPALRRIADRLNRQEE